MTLLKINARSRMSLHESEDDIHRNVGVSAFGGLFSMKFDRGEVLGALVAILAWADEPYRTTVVRAQRLAVQVIREQHVVSKGIL